jgi:hypothetical protein
LAVKQDGRVFVFDTQALQFSAVTEAGLLPTLAQCCIEGAELNQMETQGACGFEKSFCGDLLPFAPRNGSDANLCLPARKPDVHISIVLYGI